MAQQQCQNNDEDMPEIKMGLSQEAFILNIDEHGYVYNMCIYA